MKGVQCCHSMPHGYHTLLLLEEGGSLVGFGRNKQGQLGLGHCEDQLVPVIVPWDGPRPVQVEWGRQHSLVLDEEGSVWEAGRFCSASTSATFRPIEGLPAMATIACSAFLSAALDMNGALWVWTSNQQLMWASAVPSQVVGIPILSKVACGGSFLVGETSEGVLWVLGLNGRGQLGLGHTDEVKEPTIVQSFGSAEGPSRSLGAFYEGIVLIDSEGVVFTAGDNDEGQLGRSGDEKVFLPINRIPCMSMASCGNHHAIALDEEGGVWTWGHGYDGQLGDGSNMDQLQPTLLQMPEEVIDVSAGGNHSLVFSQKGSLFVFGYNYNGTLGLNTTDNQSLPTICPLRASPRHPVRCKQKSARF